MAKNRKQLRTAQYAGSREKKRSRRKKRRIILAAEVIILLLLVGTVGLMAKYNKFQTVTINNDELGINDGIGQEGYMTVALFGGDSRDGQLEEGTHADTMIVVSIDNETREVRMASVYRDTILRQKDGDYQKANYAYFAGGPKEAISLLNKNLDLDIEDYVTVDFKALTDTIDLLGGIDINIREEEIQPLNKYIRETAEVAGTKANLISDAGEQHLDGAQAVTYARIRSTEGGDYTRTKRQRLVIEKLFEKVIKTNLSTVNKIIDAVFPQVSTSFTLKEMLALASGLTKYRLGENTGFPIDKTAGEYDLLGSIVIPLGHVENVRKLHEFLYPKEKDYVPSKMVEEIAADITFKTGVSALDAAGADTPDNGSVDNTDMYGGASSSADSYEYEAETDTYGGDQAGGNVNSTDMYGDEPYTVDSYEEETDTYGGDQTGDGSYGADSGETVPY